MNSEPNCQSYKVCPRDDHRLPLNTVCLEYTCNHRGVLCQECISQSHKGHRLCPISNLANHIKEQRNHRNAVSQRVKSDVAHLTAAKKLHVELLRKIRQQIDQSLNEAEVLTTARFDILEERVHAEATMYHKVEELEIPSADLDANAYLRGFKHVADEIVRAGHRGSYLVELITHSVKEAVQVLNKMESILAESMKTIERAVALADMINENPFGSLQPSALPWNTTNGLKWSSTMKHQDIAIELGQAWREGHTSARAVGILLEECIGSGPSLKHSWSIRVLRKKGHIFVGICSPTSAISSTFDDHLFKQSEAHWHYVISQETAYSHHDPLVNGRHIKFFVKQGDVLNLEHDKTQNQLLISNQLKETYNLEVRQAASSQTYHGCVYLSAPGDAVQILTHHI